MPLSRLLAIALLVFPFTVFGQSNQNNNDVAPATQQVATATVPAEPWRILPNDLSKPVTPRDSLSQQQIKQSENLVKPNDPAIILQDRANGLANKVLLSSEGRLLDTTCFTIRSYVVARDSKTSDSTHLVHYSTCQPASKYRVKTIELKAQPPSQ